VSKIPAIKWEFWIDKKSHRKMFTEQVDKEITAKLQKKQKRTLNTSSSGN